MYTKNYSVKIRIHMEKRTFLKARIRISSRIVMPTLIYVAYSAASSSS